MNIGKKSAFILGLMLSGASHAEPHACKAARGNWHRPVLPQGHLNWNRVSLAHDGNVFWNGSKISETVLITMLRAAHRLNPEPEVYLEAEMGVSCARLEAIRDRMEENLHCQGGRGNCVEGYPNFVPMPTNGG